MVIRTRIKRISRTREEARESLRVRCGFVGLISTLVVAFVIGLALTGAVADDDNEEDENSGGQGGFCSQTANLLFRACGNEVQDDFFKAQAICLNVSDKGERAQCLADTITARNESRELCSEQRTGRLDTCKALGEDRYDPNFDPALFDDPKHPTHPNPYFPLTVGNRWEYHGGNEVNTVKVLNETKLIEGVTCAVFSDQVFKDGDLAEDTDDWFCPAKDGNVWYFGEEVKDFESFDGDNPRKPELVSIDGSFKAGRNGDKPGIIFLASPKPSAVYLEEFSLGNAEDVTQVLSTTYKFGSNSELDQLVPQQLAQMLCSGGDCVVTKNFSLLEPGDFARKYYARGIGVFLEVESSGKVIQLVNCNFDPRCAALPSP